mgnify:CR=1 FL=1
MSVLTILSAFTVYILAAKRPFNKKFTNIVNLISEVAFLLIFIGFLVLLISRNKISRYPREQYIGRPLIAIVFLIAAKCVVEYIVFLVEIA